MVWWTHVDTEDKQTSRFATGGQQYNMTVINESGLYSLILSSKLDSARRFKHWGECGQLRPTNRCFPKK